MTASTPTIRRRLDVRGQVQGVGFRPYVYRLALAHALGGSVANNSNGAVIEVEGPPSAVDAFQRDLVGQLPPLARIAQLVQQDLSPLGEPAFRIRTSQADQTQRPEVTPDAATCLDCLRELFDPADRRFRYPFINCTNCGPRYSIIRSVPYDRPKTTMAVFQMCPQCQGEYDDPADRRFHAQPNACPDCGPELQIDLRGTEARRHEGTQEEAQRGTAVSAVTQTAKLLQNGAILAIKGIGGYHLACRADCEDVVERLRQRKLRDGKPLAVMVPDLAAAHRVCRLSAADEEALTSPAAPIVLAPKANGHGLAPSVAPGCSDFGLMLPYAPLHHLLFAEGLGPLVMTSANLAGAPLTYRDEDARRDLGDVADAFLLHNREIFRPIDDSVVITFRDEAVPFRRARGYAPRPIRLAGFDKAGQRRVLAVGGELKATVCLLAGGEAILSEHLGDLTQADTYRHYVQAIGRLQELCGFTADAVACDLHPQYLSTDYARRLGLPVIAVQHHHAHIASVMAEWGDAGPVIGLACDGTGFGPDRAIWGCEVLRCERGSFDRLGHLEYYPLVGGDLAAIETWRPAAALLRAAGQGDWHASLPSPEEARVFEQQIQLGVNAPPTSSLGRVFDAVSFLLGLCTRNRHEAEAAMALEAAAADEPLAVAPYAYVARQSGDELHLSLLPTIRDIVQAVAQGEPIPHIAARFHESVARTLADAAHLAADRHNITKVALSGGCFANRRLLARLVNLLEADGRQVLYHRQVPPGDGGLALGQALVAAWQVADAL